MPIPESQLDTWSAQGAVKQSRDTYATVKSALEDTSAPYNSRDYTIFLQGSYGNDTNIYADSDVDVVIRLDSIFYKNLESLSPEDKAAYNSASGTTEYSYTKFKAEVVAQLQKKFPGKVKAEKKAIFVAGEGNRRDCDVLAAVVFRKYWKFRSWSDQSFTEGICFWNSAGDQIVNYPKQHSENCTTKHQNADQWFKPSVRILKNLRNAMIKAGHLADGIAPSYFLEGMLYNVPNQLFGTNYQDTIVNALNWLIKEADRDKLVCANEQYYLLNPTSLVTWRAENMQAFLDAAVKFWKEW